MEAPRKRVSTESSKIEAFLAPKHRAGSRKVSRDKNGRPLLVEESALDTASMAKSGVTLVELGKRVRVFADDMSHELASYIIPSELIRYGSDNPQAADGCKTPLGNTVYDHGLYMKLRPGLCEVGVNDRQDIVLLDTGNGSDPTVGPVINSANTVIAGRAKRLVTRVHRPEHEADRKEALAWLKAFDLVDGKRTLRSRYSCAGIQYEHRGNVPYLNRTTQLNFFDPKDPDMAKISADVTARFKRLRRPAPRVEIVSLLNVPDSEAAYRDFVKKLKRKKGNPEKLGLPPTLRQSRFWDPESKAVVSSNFVFFCPLSELGDLVTVMTVNTDYHGEVKSRGVLSPLMAIMSLVGIISAHAGCAVENSRGTVTTFTGPTGTGKTTATTFWAEQNEKYRRRELRRRYEIDIEKQNGGNPKAVQRDVDKVMRTVGILCQEDWVEIVPLREGKWVFWPTERACYARTGGFPGLRFVLAENEPLLENACADLGAAGTWEKLGRVTHDYFPERLFYDPAWGHMLYDRTPRAISANVFLERDRSLDFCVKRVAVHEAVDWLLKGRTPAGKYEPLYNAYPDFSGLLMQYGIVGDRLITAYQEARQGHPAALAQGNNEIGRALYDKLHLQVELWTKHCQDVPVFIVNGAPGLEITQDINWYLSEYPEFLAEGEQMSTEQFKDLMHGRYGVTYGHKGEWTHVDRSC